MPLSLETINLDFLENLGGREQEALFARDEDGNLIRKEKATRAQYEEQVAIVLDGVPVTVPKAVPATDALGNEKKDKDGLSIPRATTIYDAAARLVQLNIWSADDLKRRLPVLCHQQHLTPVAMCRVCSVHVSKRRKRDGKLAPSEKLVPACQHEVQPDMVVTGRQGAHPNWEKFFKPVALEQKRKELEGEEKRKKGDPNRDDAKNPLKTPEQIAAAAEKGAAEAVEVMRESLTKYAPVVQQAVGVLTEFLLTDHHHPDRERDTLYRNELQSIAKTTGHLTARVSSLPDMDLDTGELEASDEEFKPRLGLKRNPGGDKGRNFRIKSPKSRPLPLQVVAPPADDADLKDDPAWVEQDKKDYEQYPYSARTIVVDHDRCILCDRCVRSCSEVKPFKIIGHTGKGYKTRISFDLDQLMNESNCVQCGECMTSCPTGALTLKRRVAPKAFPDSPPIPKNPHVPLPQPQKGAKTRLLNAKQMVEDVELTYKDQDQHERKFYPFATIPFSYLRWNEGSVRERKVEPGEVLCEQGEYGRTAFFLKSGLFEVIDDGRAPGSAPAGKGGFLSKVFGGTGKTYGPVRQAGTGKVLATIDHLATVLGEQAALTARPRVATIKAKTHGVVYEVTRNLLDMAQRSQSARDVLGLIYVRNAIRSLLRSKELFADLTEARRSQVADFLTQQIPRRDRQGKVVNDPKTGKPEMVDRAVLRRVEPGEAIVSQGRPAVNFYLIRLGTVKITRAVAGREVILGRQAENEYFGHIGLLKDELGKHPEAKKFLTDDLKSGRRTATVTALDPVEVVRIDGASFREMCATFPELGDRLVKEAVGILTKDKGPPKPIESERLAEFLNQGLYHAQRMLVLDLQSCTRCDECTRACADSHGDGVSRLLREGLRFGSYLVAASCRSCVKPYCMDGCPVDAIHRSPKSLEVVVDSHCIGCSLCEKNCPYGSIQMVTTVERGSKARTAADVQRAVNCDLCHGLVDDGADTFCVSACPHTAAFRWDAPTLMKAVEARG